MSFEIRIYRNDHQHDRSLGELFVTGFNGRFCYTLEDAIRAAGIKIYGKTGLPAGVMKGRIVFSTRFQREMIAIYTNGDYVLLNGIRFDGVRMHGGNRPEDTEACVLTAYNRNKSIIWGTAEKDLTKYVKSKVGYDEFDILIFNNPHPASMKNH
jgi:hypothetical protein